MRHCLAALITLLFISTNLHAQLGRGARVAVDPDKAAAFDWLDRNAAAMKALGVELWGTPELSFREFRSSRALVHYLEGHGFTVTSNAAGLPTAFVASAGDGKPVI